MERMEAKDLVIKAGLELVNEALIARTWGNISCRIDDKQFVITPSGKSYEDLVRSEIVPVDIADESWAGTVKPSSEKGVHAVIYALHPEVNFIIHTHQNYATALGALGKDLRGYGDEYAEVLGKCVPCAKYGISTTKPLRDNVLEAATTYMDSKAVLMRNHGTVAFGADYDEAFKVVRTLEKLAKERFEELTGAEAPDVYVPESEEGQKLVSYRENGSDIFAFLKSPYVKKMADIGEDVPSFIDDMSQMSGAKIPCLPYDASMETVARKLEKAPAVLVKNRGAVCSGYNREEADAVCMVLEKNCTAAYLSHVTGSGEPVGKMSSLLEHMIYVKKYSKLKNS